MLWFWTHVLLFRKMRRPKRASKNHAQQFPKQWKFNQKWSPERIRMRNPLRHRLRKAFWFYFGFMLAQFCVPFRSQSRSKLLLGALGTPLENDSDFESPSREAPAAVGVAPAWLAEAAAFESQRHSGQKCCKNEGGSGGGEKRSPKGGGFSQKNPWPPSGDWSHAPHGDWSHTP